MSSGPEGRKRVIVAVTGSSGPQYGIRLLEVLHELQTIETHLVLSRGSSRSIAAECDRTIHEIADLADVVYDIDNVGAAIASGSFITSGMVIIPCSMRTLASVANGLSGDLIGRAADVCLKERRTLIVVPRETPLSLIHIRNMESVTLAGAIVMPPVPSFYYHPVTIADLIDHLVARVLDQLGVPHNLVERWR